MSQNNIIKLRCSDCKELNYWSRKNVKLIERKIELKKFCNTCRKHVLHSEMSKKAKQ